MFCINCGKQFQGEGYLCPECAAAKEGGASPAAPQALQQSAYTPPVYQPPVMPETPAGGYVPPVRQETVVTPGFTLGSPEGGRKKKNVGFVILVIVLALALVCGAVALALNWDKLFQKVPEDPAEYVAFLEEPRMQALTDGLTQAYGKWLESPGKGASMDMDMKLYLGDDLLNVLSQAMAMEGMSDLDMKWLQEITLRLHTNIPEDLSAGEFGLDLLLGSTHLIGLDSVVDMENMLVYLAIPELNSRALKIDYQQMMAQQGVSLDVEALMKMSEQLVKDMPNQEAVGALAEGCGNIILSYLTDARMQTQTLTVGKAEQEVTVLTVRLSAKQLAKMIRELLEYIRDNDAANQAVEAIVAYTNAGNRLMGTGETVSAEDFDRMLAEGIDEMKDAAKNAEEGNYLVLTTYASGDQVLGRGLQIFTDDQPEGQIGYAALAQEDTVYLEAFLDEQFRFTGEGQLKKGLLTGEYILNVEGDDCLLLALENVDMATGLGSYELSLEPGLIEQMEMDSMAGALASSFAIRLELWETGGKLALVTGKTTLVSLGLEAAVGEGSKVEIPTDALALTDEAALEQWIQGLRLDGLAQSLKEAGLPQELQVLVDALVQQWNCLIAGSQIS